MLPTILIVLAVSLVAIFWTALNGTFRRLEEQNGHLDDGRPSVLRYRVPVGMDAASAVVNLDHQGYDVTIRYEHGETDLYIRTITGLPNEREVIRALIYNAHVVDHQTFRPPAPIWHPEPVVFADEAADGS